MAELDACLRTSLTPAWMAAARVCLVRHAGHHVMQPMAQSVSVRVRGSPRAHVGLQHAPSTLPCCCPRGCSSAAGSAVLCVPRRGSACSQKRRQRRERRSWLTCTSRSHHQTWHAQMALGVTRNPSRMGRNNRVRSRPRTAVCPGCCNSIAAAHSDTKVLSGHAGGHIAERLLHWAATAP